ncbi:aldo/keto reductase [Bacillus cereus]
MEFRRLGKTNLDVSALGFGGATIGFNNVEQNIVNSIIKEANEIGINVIDTAECYGESETLIGNAIKGLREKFFIFTKCGHASGLDLVDWSKDLLEKSIDRSLKRLNTNYIDVMQLHGCSINTLENSDVLEVLKRAQEKGKIRYIGYSGDGEDALYAIKTGHFDVLQTSINIADQQAIRYTIPEAINFDMGIIAKRPIANIAWKDIANVQLKRLERTLKFQERLGNVSTKDLYTYRLKNLNYDFMNLELQDSISYALRFTLSVPAVSTMVVGTTNAEHLLKNNKIIAHGKMPTESYDLIRAKWDEISSGQWKSLS